MVRALASHARGHRFKSCCLHQKNVPFMGAFFGNVPYLQQDLRVGSVLREQNGLLAEEEYKKKMDSKLNDW